MDRETLVELGKRLESEIPNAADEINCRLCEEGLREMCLEYEECTRSLHYWEESQSNDKRRIREYSELLADLEREILSYLKAPKRD